MKREQRNDTLDSRVRRMTTELSELRREAASRTAGQPTWIPFVPTWKGVTADPAIGDGAMTARYAVMSGRADVTILLTVGAATTFGTGGWYFSVPQIFASTALAVGVALALDSSAALRWSGAVDLAVYEGPGGAGTTPPTVRELVPYFGAGVARTSATVPFTWAVGDTLALSVSSEAFLGA